jgi:hypothetical protein
MFNKEYISKVCDLYNCNQMVVDREGNVYALRAEGQLLIPGLVFDTTTVDGTLAQEAIDKAKGV